jgi:glycosyltransferase involved in cell wall biosynthesis
MATAIETARESFNGKIVWIQEMLPTDEKIHLYSHASLFCTPSIYEPFGIINLEAMACETPVVASNVGGMKEIIVPGKTGLLVDLEQQRESPFEASDPANFAQDLAAGINELMRDDSTREKMAKAGRERVLSTFSWDEIAKETLALYERIAK